MYRYKELVTKHEAQENGGHFWRNPLKLKFTSKQMIPTQGSAHKGYRQLKPLFGTTFELGYTFY